MSVDMAIMKAIGLHEKKQLLIDAIALKGEASLMSNVSAAIRRIWHVLYEEGAKQSRARMLVESILQSAMEMVDSDEDVTTMMSSDSITNMLDFAECRKATDLYNCSALSIYQFRTADSTCNNLYNPLWGASNTAFGRVQPAHYEDGIQSPVGFSQLTSGQFFSGPWPSAREVSRRIVRDLPPRAPLSHMFAIWSQNIAHDLGNMPVFDTNACAESCDLIELAPFCSTIPVNPVDNVYGTSGQNMGRCLFQTRSVGECIQPEGNETFDMARQQLNQVTSYLDASTVYGSTAEHTASLRLFKAGLMKVGGRLESDKGNPPFDTVPTLQGIPQFAFGDVRGNALTALMTLQTILLREHNRLAKQLAIINPCWDDERLFQEARKIVGALVQIVTYKEYLPLLYGQHFQRYIGSYPGYSSSVDASISNEFDTAAFRFGHSLISDTFARLDSDNNPLPIGPLGFRESAGNSLQYFISGGTDPLLRGLLQDRSRAGDAFIIRAFTSQLFAPTEDSLGLDIASLDIQRGREHGLAPYRAYEQFCRNKFNVESRFTSPLLAVQLRSVYGRDGFENGMDLWAGGLAEQHLEGANLGPTYACLMAMTFSNVRNGDRLWWQNLDVFTDNQQASLATIRLSKIICDNADNIPTIKRNVFLPGGQQVACDNLPSLDLSLWKDNCCQ